MAPLQVKATTSEQPLRPEEQLVAPHPLDVDIPECLAQELAALVDGDGLGGERSQKIFCRLEWVRPGKHADRVERIRGTGRQAVREGLQAIQRFEERKLVAEALEKLRKLLGLGEGHDVGRG